MAPFRVDFFNRWLQFEGTDQVAAEISDKPAVLAQLHADAEIAIKSGELVDVSREWIYKGHKVTPDEVRAWLEQFGGPQEQRLMFKILKHVRFVTSEQYYRAFAQFAADVQKQLITFRAPKSRKWRDIIVSYLDGPGKSGAGLARKFADAASILTEKVVERGRMRVELDRGDPVRAIIFVDDIIGSGGTAVDGVTAFWDECGKEIKKRGSYVYFLALLATHRGRDRVLELVETLYPGKFLVRTLQIYGEEKRLFSNDSEPYPDPGEREKARELAAKFGERLEPNWPLGFEDGQLAVVFEASCPNNTIPILRKRKGDWPALFPRHGD
jgi:hypothetical protein